MSSLDPRVPSRDECVLRYVLERRAGTQPDKAFIRLGDGSAISYREFRDSVVRTAAGLAALGVKQDDTVTVWLPNGVDMIRVWFAINWLGATYVPVNTAYRGNLLAHVLANAGSDVIVASVDLVGRLADIDRARLGTAVVLGGPPEPVAGLRVLPESALDADPGSLPPLSRPIEPWDVQSIVYTSGTTGRSKGVISSYAHLHSMSGPQSLPMLGEDDVLHAVRAAVPRRGDAARGGLAEPRRDGRGGRRVRHRGLLARGARNRRHLRDPARGDDQLRREAPARRRTTGTTR